MKIKVSNILNIGFFYCIFYTLTRACLGKEFGKYPFYLYLILMGIITADYIYRYKFQIIKIKRNDFFISFFLYLIFIFFNLIFCKNSSTYAFYEYYFYFMMFFATCNTIRRIKFSHILYFYECVGIILSLEAVWEFSTGRLPYRVSIEEQNIRRACGLLGTPLTLGMVLACISLIAFYLAKIENNKKHYYVFLLMFIGLLTTQSRGPLMGFVVGFLVMYALLTYKQTGKVFNTIFKNVFKIIILIVCVYLFIIIFKDKIAFVNTIYKRIITISQWGGEDRSNALRRERWQLGLKYFKENPIWGYGVSSSGTHAVTGINVESGVIKKLMETGLIGFCLYYYTFGITFIKKAKKCMKKKTKYYPLAVGVIVAIFVENMVLQIIEAAAAFMLFIIFFSYLVFASDKKAEKMIKRKIWEE